VQVIKSRRIRWAEYVAQVGEGREVYRSLVSNSKGKRPLWRPRSRKEVNIKVDLPEAGCGGMDRVELV
jgi:hypothetical protein